MKIIGALMIIFSSISFGLYYRNCMKKQIKILNELLLFCTDLKTAISFKLVTVGDFINSIDLNNEYKNLDFLSDVSCADNISLDLSKEENDRISKFFSTLGKYDMKNQINEIDYFIAFLNLKSEERKQQYNQKSKLCMVMSFSIGAVISLVII